jgi:tRNA uridine 5-carbamoylmethylation protein Kti12
MIKKQIRTVLSVLFIAGLAQAANTNQNSASSSRSMPEHIQQAMDQAKEINQLSKQIAKEKDLAVREALISNLRAEFVKQSEQMDAADQQRLADFDAQREKMVQSVAEARAARQQHVESFIRNLSASPLPAAQ